MAFTIRVLRGIHGHEHGTEATFVLGDGDRFQVTREGIKVEQQARQFNPTRVVSTVGRIVAATGFVEGDRIEWLDVTEVKAD